jgi:hypothetical protein
MRRLTLVAAVLLPLIAGCGDQPTAPVGEPVLITLSLSARSGDPAHPITATVRLKNVGWESVTVLASCSGPGFGPAIHAPDRANILDVCAECAPSVPCPLMSCAPRILRPRESIQRTVEFGGTLASCEGPYDGPSGIYTVEGGTVYTFASGAAGSVSTSATFTWSTTPPR